LGTGEFRELILTEVFNPTPLPPPAGFCRSEKKMIAFDDGKKKVSLDIRIASITLPF